MARRVRRTKNQLPESYYEGYLEKRSFRDKTSQKLWTSLCGKTMFFFNDKRDADYVEKLDLGEFVSVTDDSSPDRNLDTAKFNLQMKDENLKLSAPNAEIRELWKGYIHAVAELLVPSSLNLLPGQIHMLKEVVEKEKDKIKSSVLRTVPESSLLANPKADGPGCFHLVSRVEAELLLEREAERGNFLLRPGRDGASFAVTTRQDLDGAIFKHYRVSRNHEGGFVIDVENPVPCATLHQVVTFMVESTKGSLVPLNMEEPYEKSITFISSDCESGERTRHALPDSNPPAVPPKPVSPKIGTSEPDVEENRWCFDRQKTKENEMDDFSAAPRPKPAPRETVKAQMPPVPAPRTTAPANTHSRTVTMKENQIPMSAISELKLRFAQRASSQE
ncbi:signal-transducing adaptor protein 2-like [Menidia menidia]